MGLPSSSGCRSSSSSAPRRINGTRAGVPRPQSGRWGVMPSLEIYRAILTDIRNNGYDVFTRRAGAARLQKLGLALKARIIDATA
jgi:phytoene/squalene synthetase